MLTFHTLKNTHCIYTVDSVQYAISDCPYTVGKGIVLEVNKHLRHVKNAVLDAACLWYDIGLVLGVLTGTLQSIKFDKELHEDNDRLNEVLLKWMHSGQATIHQLLEALVDPSVYRVDIANKIRALRGEERSKVGLP